MTKPKLERIIAGSLVESLPYNREQYLKSVEFLKPEHFKNEVYRSIFEAFIFGGLNDLSVKIGTLKKLRKNFACLDKLRDHALNLMECGE